jgi:XTP/dITP diphosphohydrolase
MQPPDVPSFAELFIATGNEHKLIELTRLFPGISLHLPREAGVSFDFEETGSTYLDNAIGKALHLYRRIRKPVLADDSGLEVLELGEEPGVRSSRYGATETGRKLSDADRNVLLLAQARNLRDRSCRFVCCMVLLFSDARYCVAQETCEGVLTTAPRGSGGFGYDPIVWLPERGKTVAELTDPEKDEVSHRGKAARRLMALLAAAPRVEEPPRA